MLRGSLDDFTLPDIFRLMSFAKKTGRLDVVRSAGEGKVFFREGEVYFAESSISKEPIGQKLLKARAVTEGQLMKALDEHKASGERLGTVLLNSGVVSQEQLENAIRQQIEDAIFDLLRWELGEFDWEPGTEMTVEIPIAVSVENLIMEASRRLDEFEVIKRKIPSEETVLGMAPTPPEGAVEINITPEEWRILVLVDGNRTVGQIGQMVGLDGFSAMRVLYGLVSAGLIEVVDGSVPAAAEADEIEEVEEVEEAEVIAEIEEPEAVEAEAVEPEPAAEPEPEPQPAAVAEAIEEIVGEELEDPAAEVVGEEVVDEGAAEAEPVAAAGEESQPETFSEIVAGERFEADEPTPESVLADPLGDLGGEPLGDPEAVTEMTAEELAQFGIAAPSADEGSDAAWGEETAVAGFDAPGPDDLVTETPEPDPFIADLFGEVAEAQTDEAPETPAAPDAPPPPEKSDEMPVSSAPSGEAPVVDRAAVVRELAGLFSDEVERPRARPSAPRPAAKTPAGGAPEAADPDDTRKRVEDDDQITKGIISRLIDGVKGL